MKVLILGGTKFFGRHCAEIALKQGYQITLFNRGQTNNSLYPNVEKLVGDRIKGDLVALQGRKWDVVIDTAGYFPNLPDLVRETAELLKDAVSNYVFISTISVYTEFQANGDETLPLYPINQELPQEMNAQAYGTLKAMAESVVQEVYGERGLIVRPGLIVGPYDNTGRFTYWIRRIHQGGEVLAPESPELPVQYIDARDLVQWIYQLVSTRKMGIYNAVGPKYSLKLGDFLATCQQVTDSSAKFSWIPGEILESQGIEPWQELPLWLPPQMQNTFACLSNSKALANGLSFRPLAETIHDIWQWDQVEQLEYASGLSRDKETAILQLLSNSISISPLLPTT
ncbi:MAG TPA: NAD-dependent epimerase/dehydratase family protein [Trichormus sp. M33_DOE_039]|nr:NAD-dependent epimerase/dehydratase family protein [Trichormus sp. M33_DOE_039]